MKERPILFSGEMVRAILNGRKTMTRRVVKQQPSPDPVRIRNYGERYGFMCESNSGKVGIFQPANYHCPYGTVGDRLWVRETVFQYGRWIMEEDQSGEREQVWHGGEYHYCADEAIDTNRIIRKRPSIHMPRRLCRILLEITEIRVERLNDISESDAQAEGSDWYSIQEKYPYIGRHQQAFKQLWESINGSGSWEKNPWVWVICFKRVS